jgi:hypothetical protein
VVIGAFRQGLVVDTNSSPNSRTGEKRAESEQVEMECPAIFPEAMFTRVQCSLKAANPKTERSRAVTGPILLTEIARCELCESAMTLRTGTSSTGRTKEPVSGAREGDPRSRRAEPEGRTGRTQGETRHRPGSDPAS